MAKTPIVQAARRFSRFLSEFVKDSDEYYQELSAHWPNEAPRLGNDMPVAYENKGALTNLSEMPPPSTADTSRRDFLLKMRDAAVATQQIGTLGSLANKALDASSLLDRSLPKSFEPRPHQYDEILEDVMHSRNRGDKPNTEWIRSFLEENNITPSEDLASALKLSEPFEHLYYMDPEDLGYHSPKLEYFHENVDEFEEPIFDSLMYALSPKRGSR
jgi:hypothetical protein